MPDRDKTKADKFADLRQRAEELLPHQPKELAKLSPEDMQHLLHNLQVYQIELEMQNNQLRQTQQQLEESRAKYTALYDLAPVAYFTIAETGLILEANLTGANLLGVDSIALLKQSISRFMAGGSEDVFYLHRQQVLKTRTRQTCELKMVKQDGSQFYARLESVAVVEGEGEDSYERRFRTAIIDITKPKQTEEALRRDRDALEQRVEEQTADLVKANIALKQEIAERKQTEQEIRLLQSITQAISEAPDFHTALAVVLQKVCQATGWNFGETWIPWPDGALLECSPVWYSSANSLKQFRKASQEITFRPGKGLPGRVWSSKQPEWIQDVSIEPEEFFHRVQIAEKAGLKAGLGIPVMVNNQVLAVLAFFTFDSIPENERQLKLVATIATQLSAIIQHKQSETEMQKLSNALEQTADSVYITDREGVIEYVNPTFEQTTGYSKAEVMGQTPRILKSGQHEERFYDNLWDIIRAGEVFKAIFTNRRKNGELFYDDRIITPLKDSQDHITHFVSTGRDITQRRLTQQALQESEERFRTVFESAPIGMVMTNKEGRFKQTNQAFQEMMGYTEDELHRMAFVDITDPDQVTESWGLFMELMKGKRTVIRTERRYHRQDGRLIWGHVTVFVVRDAQGEFQHTIAMIEDITERKQAEMELEQRAAQLALINNIGSQIVAVLKLDSLLDRAAHLVQETFDYHHVALFLVEGKVLRLKAIAGSYKAYFPTKHTQRLSEGINGWVATNGEKVIANDVSAEPRYTSLIADHTITQAELCLPLKIATQTLGVLNIQSPHLNAFSENDVMVMEALSNQIAIALENARLYTKAHQHTQELTTLNMVMRGMASILDLNAVLQQALAGIKTMLAAEGASALLFDSVSGDLVFVAAVSPNAAMMMGQQVPLDTSIAGWTIRHKQSLLIEDVQQDARIYTQIDDLTGLTTRSLLAVPLIFQQETIGVIETINKANGVFDQHDLEILEALASSATVAIKNAQLYEAQREQYRHLQESQEELVQIEKMAAMGRLVASIAHEINNPLQSVQGFLNLLNEELYGRHRQHKLDQFLKIAESEIERITGIVRRMRDFYGPLKQEPQAQPNDLDNFYRSTQTELQTVDLHTTLESVLQLTNKKLQHSNIKVERNWSAELPKIQANSDHLKQVFLNLTLNVIDAMPEQGGSLRISTATDLLQSDGNQAQPAVRIEFSDTGTGISPQVLSRLFEPLFTTKKYGTGFGLFTSHKIIEAHRGQITATSQVGQGTTFTIFLPLGDEQ